MFKKLKAKIALMVAPLFILAVNVAGATGIQGSKYATGTTKMVRDIGAVITIIIPIACAAFIGFQALSKYYSNHDSQVTIEANKRTKAALWTAVIGTTAAGLVTLITSYYV
ncbi:hypothetical protein [Paenibacillus sp. FSL L8-0463]|uniref:hypothetical protein n=1 Tax=Paenibacillus sp. FSL L8-0463 TaxID=2954687 RepID=UPI003119799E